MQSLRNRDSVFVSLITITLVAALIFTVVLLGAIRDGHARVAVAGVPAGASGVAIAQSGDSVGSSAEAGPSQASPVAGVASSSGAVAGQTLTAPAPALANAGRPSTLAVGGGGPGGVIKVGGVCSITGPIYYGAGCKSAAAYFKYVNARGGVNGYTFDYRFYDDGLDQQRNLSSYKRLVEEDKVFALVGSVQNLSFLAAGQYLQDQNVPLIGPGYADKEENRPNVFPLTMWVADYGGQPADYFVRVRGARKVCVPYVNVFPARNAIRQVKWLYKQMGHPEYLKDSVPVSLTEPDFSSVVIRLKSEGCDSVLTFMDPASVVRYIKAANQQNFHVPTAIPIGAWTPEEADAAGAAGEGTLAQVAWDLPQTGSAEAVLYEQQLHKYFPGEVINAFGPGGWVAAKAFVDAFRRIQGAPNRDKLVVALKSLKHWSSGLAPPFDVGAKPASKYAKFYVQKGGQWVPATDWLQAPPLCPDCLSNDDVNNIP